MASNADRGRPFVNEPDPPTTNNNSAFVFPLLPYNFLVDVSHGEFLNDTTNISQMLNNPQSENPETTLQNAMNSNLNAQNNDNNVFDETFFKEWLLDLVITINVWHIFLITAIASYLYGVSLLYLLLILGVFDLYELLFLIKKTANKKL